ncbi:hypothetical protein [Bacteroides neonati]|uniref:hypothetical protein n=1 Tax=Bacteroides neonati TaxID=1347393 RepID=UPI0004BA6852|nr:hypothetical protein [Bacteroides neonati]
MKDNNSVNEMSLVLDGMSNMLSDIKVLLEERPLSSGNEDLALLSDRLSLLQQDIQVFKDKTIVNHQDWEDSLIVVQKYIAALQVCKNMVKTRADVFAELQRIAEQVKRLERITVYKCHSFELKTSRPFFFQIGLILVITALICGNAYQLKKSHKLEDNDLKYRHILMRGGINGGKLDTLEICFNRSRNYEQIDIIREEVENFEYRSKKVAEKLEQIRLLNQEAKILQKGN